MDVIGTLAAFAPRDLQALRYISFTGTANIPRSKFVIVFSPVACTVTNSAGVSGNYVNLVAPGGSCEVNYSTTGAISIFAFSSAGTTVTYGLNITIAYCPV